MSEEATTVTTTAPAAPAAGADETVERWVEDLRSQKQERERARGIPPTDEVDAGAGPAAPGKTATPPPPPAPAPESKRPDVALANQKFRERQRARNERNERNEMLERQNRELREAIAEALDRGAVTPGERGAERRGTTQDPEPDYYQDPKSWHEWARREDRRAEEGRVAAVQAQREQDENEKRTERERTEASFAELQQAEADYLETDQGQGFRDRVDLYGEAYTFALQEIAGIPEPVAKALLQDHLNKTVAVAMRMERNPAAVMDAVMQMHELIAEGLKPLYPGRAAEQAPAAQARPARPAAPAHAREALQGLNDAARAPEAHSLGERASTSPPSGDDLLSQARGGRLNSDTLRAGLERRGYAGTSLRRGVFDFLEELEKQ